MAAVAQIPGPIQESDEEHPDDERQVRFSIQNVLKKEREPSPEHGFSKDKLQSTFEEASNSSLRFDDTEISVDDNSCSSNDTVLSVGNENPANDEMSFRHIQTHLSAISQLSLNTPLLLRPNPLPMFLNQSFYPQVKYPQEERKESCGREQREESFNPSLKFSIDNILKADFGRRITDPLKIRKKRFDGKKEFKEVRQERAEVRQERPEVKNKGAIDLSKADASPASSGGASSSEGPMVWPAWVYCTRYSDRPSSGRSPRTRKPKKPPGDTNSDEKRPRTAFSGPQLARLKHEFAENRYLTERRRQALAAELGLAEAQIKIWFQNKRAKIKKASGHRNPLALQLMAQGLYNHSTIPLTKEEEELEMKAREREQAQH